MFCNPPAKKIRMSGGSASSGVGSVGSSSSFDMPLNSGKHAVMKQFISAAAEYQKSRSETLALQLNRHLQIIGVTIDLSTFDPHSCVVVEFFVSLHELMSGLDSHSTLFWGCVNVLQLACRNRAANHALIHTYQFLPILSRYLSDQSTREKKQRLLTLIQELTYGIKITWQESHLPHLIQTLVDWISSGETNIVHLALGVLINLCYKNLPAIYTLMRCVDTKSFIRTVISLDCSKIQVHIFKLVFVLENVNGEIPKEDVLKFVALTFDSVAEALKTRDVVRLRHIVDFFIDVKTQYSQPETFLEFKEFASHVEKFIKMVDSSSNESGDARPDPESVAMLFEFFRALIQLNPPDLIPFHSQLARLALNWVQTEFVSTPALKLLLCIATARDVELDTILQPLSNGLQVLLVALNTGCSSDDEIYLQSAENKERLMGLFQLLRGMVKIISLRPHVLEGLKLDAICKIFTPLTNLDYSPRIRGEETFSIESTELYMNALALVQQLSPLDQQWQTLYSSLMEHKQIISMIAYAFCKGDSNIKSLVFDLAKTSEFQTDKVANASLIYQPTTFSNDDPTLTQNHLPYTIVSFGQEQNLNSLINKLQEALENNQTTNIATSNVLELLEYKTNACNYSERVAQMSVEAAGKQVTQSKHRLAQMSAENARLRQMLMHSQQVQEKNIAHLSKIEEDMRSTVTKLAKSKAHCSEFENQLKAAQGQLQIRANELRVQEEKHQSLLAKFNEVLVQRKELEDQVVEIENKNGDLRKIHKKMEDKICDLDKKVEERKEALVKATQRITQLTEELATYEKLCKRNEEQLKQKENDYAEIQAELEDYKSKLNWIVQISQNKIDRHPS